MPGTLDDLLMTSAPTAERPLLGIMILVVEDSRLACDALRLICQRSGARIRRAESLASATRHLRTYLPRVAVVDLGLPDGSGLSLISQLSRSEPRIDAIIAMSGDDTQADAAIEAGADVFLAKPVSSISAFQSTVLGLLPRDSQPPRVSLPAADQVEPDPVALRDDLALAVDLLGAGPDGPTLDYVAAFLHSLARTAGDPALADLGRGVAALNSGAAAPASPQNMADRIRARMGSLETV